MTPRGTRGLCCVHIAQLMTHPVVCLLAYGRGQLRVKRFIYQVMMYCKLLMTSNLLDIGPKFSHRGGTETGIFAFLPLIFSRTIKNSFPEI